MLAGIDVPTIVNAFLLLDIQISMSRPSNVIISVEQAMFMPFGTYS